MAVGCVDLACWMIEIDCETNPVTRELTRCPTSWIDNYEHVKRKLKLVMEAVIN